MNALQLLWMLWLCFNNGKRLTKKNKKKIIIWCDTKMSYPKPTLCTMVVASSSIRSSLWSRRYRASFCFSYTHTHGNTHTRQHKHTATQSHTGTWQDTHTQVQKRQELVQSYWITMRREAVWAKNQDCLQLIQRSKWGSQWPTDWSTHRQTDRQTDRVTDSSPSCR